MSKDEQIEREIASAPGPDTGPKLTQREKKRLLALLPKGQPRYVRIYDSDDGQGDTGQRQFLVVFTGNYNLRGNKQGERPKDSSYKYIRVSGNGEFDQYSAEYILDRPSSDSRPVHVGRKHPTFGQHIRFSDVPVLARQTILRRYSEIWDIPSIRQLGPRELTEREVDSGLELYRQTGRPPIPVPVMPDKPFESVEVLKRDGETGQMKVTAAYFDNLPLLGELAHRLADDRETQDLAQLIADKMRDEASFGVMLNACFDFIRRLGVAPTFDMQELRRIAGMFWREMASKPDYNRLAEFVSILEDEQRGMPQHGHGPTPLQAHITLAKGKGQDYWTICGHNATSENLRFIGHDRFMTVGPPPFHEICGECSDGLAQLESKQQAHDPSTCQVVGCITCGMMSVEAIEKEEGRPVTITEGLDAEYKAREGWASSEMGFPSNGISFECHFSEDGYMLALMDTGKTEHTQTQFSKPRVAYLFCGPRIESGEDIITKGDDYFPSPMIDPTGGEAAAQWLELFIGEVYIAGLSEEERAKLSARQLKFYEEETQGDIVFWPVELRTDAARALDGGFRQEALKDFLTQEDFDDGNDDKAA